MQKKAATYRQSKLKRKKDAYSDEDYYRIGFRLLHKLNPLHFYKRLDSIVPLILSVDPRLENVIVSWLAGTMNESIAREYFSESLQKLPLSSLNFQLSTQGWCLACYSENDDTDSISEDDKHSNEPKILRIPCSSVDQNISGEVVAAIWPGDELIIKSKPGERWIVQELRPDTNKILLKQKKEVKCKINQNMKKYNYLQVHIFHIFGCMVRRISTNSNIHEEQQEIKLKNDDNNNENHSKVDHLIEYYFEFPNTDRLKSLRQLQQLVAEEKRSQSFLASEVDDTESPLRALQATAHVKQWMKTKDLQHQARSILSQIHHRVLLLKDIWLLVGMSLRTLSNGKDTLLIDFRQFSELSLQKLNGTHSSSSSSSQSKRNREEQEDDSPLYHMYPKNIEIYYKDISKAQRRILHISKIWDSLAPHTTADHPTIKRARAFLRELLSPEELNQDWSNDDGSQPNNTLLEYPDAYPILQSAAETLARKPLEFLQVDDQPNNNGSNNNNKDKSKKDIGKVVNVPVALYETDILLDLNQNNSLLAAEENHLYLSQQTDKNSRFLSMSEIPAVLQIHDMIGIPEIYHGESSHTSIFWHRIVRIDVLFGRVLLVKCEYFPPYCWLRELKVHEESAIWFGINQIWKLCIARIGEVDEDLYDNNNTHKKTDNDNFDAWKFVKDGKMKHSVFVTPCPCPKKALLQLQLIADAHPIRTAPASTPLHESPEATGKEQNKICVSSAKNVRNYNHRRGRKPGWK